MALLRRYPARRPPEVPGGLPPLFAALDLLLPEMAAEDPDAFRELLFFALLYAYELGQGADLIVDAEVADALRYLATLGTWN